MQRLSATIAESAAQRQDTFSSVETWSWLAITVMVPDAFFLLTAFTWTVALCPACKTPWAGETVSVGGGCACQVREETPVFLRVSVAVAPWTLQAPVSFGAGPGVAADVGEETGEVVASAVAVPDSFRTVGVAEEDAVGGRTGVCGRRERASAANTAMTTKRTPAASNTRCARVRLRNHDSHSMTQARLAPRTKLGLAAAPVVACVGDGAALPRLRSPLAHAVTAVQIRAGNSREGRRRARHCSGVSGRMNGASASRSLRISAMVSSGGSRCGSRTTRRRGWSLRGPPGISTGRRCRRWTTSRSGRVT
jgi:hypothetical protein